MIDESVHISWSSVKMAGTKLDQFAGTREDNSFSSAVRSLGHLYDAPSGILNDATLKVDNDKDSKNPTMAFTPPKYVQDMHAAPRFGHTNRLGKLVSANPEDALDYAQGLKQFSLFVVVPFIIWAIILVLFKFLYGIPKIGCAAGGEILDMKQLSKKGISRKQRKKRILRSWRLQTTFMISAILIPTASLIMMQNGWGRVALAWDEVQEVVDDAEAFAFRGWNVLEGLQNSRESLSNNSLVQNVIEHTKTEPSAALFTSWCPTAANGGQLEFLNEAIASLEEQTGSLLSLFDDYVPVNIEAFLTVTEATHSVDESIQWFFDNDWIWKMYIMALNVLNIFLLFCVYIFSKNDIIHLPTIHYLTFLVVPLFSVATGLLLMVTASSGVATLLNADFCAGGSGEGSPQGTIRDAILSYQYGSLSKRNDMTGTMKLVYDSFNFYAEGCLSEHPLAFLEDYAGQVNQATAYVVELSENLPNTPETLQLLNTECGGDISFLPESLVGLETDLLEVQRFITAMVDLVSCHSISPLLRRLTHGAVCSESVHGLTWIWGSSLFICICCFVMLTTRAALYNPVLKRKKRDKKPKRVVEKEFEEYKEFMTTYYEDAPEWKLQDTKKRTGILEIDFGMHIQSNPTFETEPTTGDEDNLSEDAGIVSMQSQDVSSAGGEPDDDYEPEDTTKVQEDDERLNLSQIDQVLDQDSNDSSYKYNSDYESDSDESEGTDSGDDESALLSFYTETKSILSETKSILSEAKSKASIAASHAVAKLRSLKPLLGMAGDDDEPNEAEPKDESMFLQSPRNMSQNPVVSEADYVTPPTRLSVLGLKTPPAPAKPFSFLGRTSYEASENNEMEPLTNTPPREALFKQSCGPAGVVQPRRLALSPSRTGESLQSMPAQEKVPIPPSLQQQQQTERTTTKPIETSTEKKMERRPSFLNLLAQRRHRFDSDDSSNMSLYVDD